MMQASELTEKPKTVGKIGEYTSYVEDKPFVVRYAKTIPDEETLRKLIDAEHNPDITPYLSAVFIKMDGQTDVVFGHARIHHELVNAVEQERGKKVDDWTQIQLEIDRGTVKFEKIGVRSGFGVIEDNLKLLLGRINPQVFLPQETPITIWTQLETYSYDPLKRELVEHAKGIAPGKTVSSKLGKVRLLY